MYTNLHLDEDMIDYTTTHRKIHNIAPRYTRFFEPFVSTLEAVDLATQLATIIVRGTTSLSPIQLEMVEEFRWFFWGSASLHLAPNDFIVECIKTISGLFAVDQAFHDESKMLDCDVYDVLIRVRQIKDHARSLFQIPLTMEQKLNIKYSYRFNIFNQLFVRGKDGRWRTLEVVNNRWEAVAYSESDARMFHITEPLTEQEWMRFSSDLGVQPQNSFDRFLCTIRPFGEK